MRKFFESLPVGNESEGIPLIGSEDEPCDNRGIMAISSGQHVPIEQRKIEKLLVRLAKMKPTSGKPAPIAKGANVLPEAVKNQRPLPRNQ